MVTNIGYHEESNVNVQARILQLLKAAPAGLQTETIADRLGLTRHTVAKYLEILKAEGQIHYQKVGRAKLWKDTSATTTIRLLTMDDLEEILRIEQRIEGDRHSDSHERLEYLKETAIYHLEHGDPLMNLGAEVEGTLVGFVLAEMRLWEFGRSERTGWIKVLGIDPAFQGRGVGRRLGGTLLDHFKRKNVTKVRTLVDWFEGDLISYFKSLGFNILNMIPLEKELN
jgi:ribosomal protein S18 acetylase RimI-like enzyme/biotin operon repressor